MGLASLQIVNKLYLLFSFKRRAGWELQVFQNVINVTIRAKLTNT